AAGRGDDDEGLAEHAAHRQPRHLRPGVEGAGDQSQIELAGPERLDELARALLHELELDAGVVAMEAADRLGDEAHAQRRGRTEADPAAPQYGELVHVA